MKKVRRAHLWIGLVCSVFIFIEAFTGLLMNEPWLIGQSGQGAFEGGQGFGMRGNYQPGQFNQGQNNQFRNNQGQNSQGSSPSDSNGTNQFQGQNRFRGNGQFPGAFNRRQFGNQNSFVGFIRGLHEGRIGTTNIKWIMDLAALGMMFLTATGIYLSIKTLSAEKKRKNRYTVE